MKKKTNNVLKIILIILGVLVALALIGALARILYLTPMTSTGSVQIVNPASLNCIDMGGELDIRADSEGNQEGICIKDGNECGEWALFKGECSL